MAHKVHIQSKEQHLAALRVLDRVKGTWLGIGSSADPVLVVTDDQFHALVAAGVVSANGKEVKARAAKSAKKTKS